MRTAEPSAGPGEEGSCLLLSSHRNQGGFCYLQTKYLFRGFLPNKNFSWIYTHKSSRIKGSGAVNTGPSLPARRREHDP
jgi:hypothetical protein